MPTVDDAAEPSNLRSPLTRRGFVTGAGAMTGAAVFGAALSACAGGGTTQPAVSVPSNAPEGTLALLKDVPVGGGVISEGVVLTQPTAGTIEAFTATCTHQGCALAEVAREEIVCPCHGSRFHLDGTVAKGPAEAPLKKVAVRVDGGNIIRG